MSEEQDVKYSCECGSDSFEEECVAHGNCWFIVDKEGIEVDSDDPNSYDYEVVRVTCCECDKIIFDKDDNTVDMKAEITPVKD